MPAADDIGSGASLVGVVSPSPVWLATVDVEVGVIVRPATVVVDVAAVDVAVEVVVWLATVVIDVVEVEFIVAVLAAVFLALLGLLVAGASGAGGCCVFFGLPLGMLSAQLGAGKAGQNREVADTQGWS